MELLYLWIEDYKNIHHQGFNFSPKYRFEFEPEFKKGADGKFPKDKEGKDIFEVIGGTLKDEMSDNNKNNSIYENFFEPSQEVKDAWNNRKDESGNPIHLGTITNITAIIGANGAGKSNLLEFMLIKVQPYLCNIKSDLKLDYNFILIFKKENQIFIFKMIDFMNLTNIDIEIWNKNYPDFRDNLNISFSHQLDSNLNDVPKNILYSQVDKPIFYSISTSSFIKTLTFGEFISQEIHRQIEFVGYNQKDRYIKLSFDTPEAVHLKINNKHLEDIKTWDNLSDPFFSIIESSFQNFYKKVKKESLEDKLRILNIIRVLDIYLMKILYFLPDISNPEGLENGGKQLRDVQEIFSAFFTQLISNTVDISLVANFLRPKLNLSKEVFKNELLDRMNEFEEFLNVFSELCDIKDTKDIASVSVNRFLEILDQYDKLKFYFFNFNWQDLSTGEVAFLNLYARFHSIFKTSYNLDSISDKVIELRNYNSLLILIDEGEVGFHPEWQRKYLKYLIDFFPQIYHGARTQIQIILTTHSPFLASDLPKENIIFLKKGEQGEIIESDKSDANGKCIVFDGLKKNKTFGANIHTLLSDGFFLNEGLIGEFAKGKINEVIRTMEPLLKYPKEKRDLEYESRILEKEIDKKLKETEIEHLDKEYESQKEKFNKEKGKIKKIIDAIGEPIVQDKLLQMYYTIESKDAKEAQIKFHQEKIRKLEENDSNKNS